MAARGVGSLISGRKDSGSSRHGAAYTVPSVCVRFRELGVDTVVVDDFNVGSGVARMAEGAETHLSESHLAEPLSGFTFSCTVREG